MTYRADFKSMPAKMVIRVFCAWCKQKEKVDGKWIDTVEYNNQASHGICKECIETEHNKIKGKVSND